MILQAYVLQIPDNEVYTEGQYIVCTPHGICLFLQKTTEDVPGSDIKKLLDLLAENDCKVCGSIPTGYLQGVDDIENGELTANYVGDKDGCTGVCDTGI